ncbi:MAG: hypothetical protein A2636_04820 [Elusimicrobia bacterium RIFCSPHIGHO2_01_FULL_64_10]|nr:MAG: hypothetical protein A2636_04820 [Elusimicrobia bacterium RIFCSPHIGHO2_01_FULL_64_10]
MSSREVAGKSGSNFISSFRFLDREKREALTAVYAYCRLTDDIVDLASDPGSGVTESEAEKDLAAWERATFRALDGGSNGAGGHPVLGELSWAVGKFGISREHVRELIRGMRMDLQKKSYATFEELRPYCYRVAGVVGLMCLDIFGAADPGSKDFAVDLGTAFQLTNILRDVRADLDRGRIYVPEEDLKRFGFDPGSFRDFCLRGPGSAASAFRGLMEFECARAESFYGRAREDLPAADRRSLAAAEVMARVYHAILAGIRKDPLRSLGDKVRLSKPELLLRVLQGWAENRLSLRFGGRAVS